MTHLLAALLQQALQIVDEGLQYRVALTVQHRRDLRRIETQAVVAALFQHAGDAERRPFGVQLALQHQPQAQATELQRRAAHRNGVEIVDFGLVSQIARQRFRAFLKDHVFTPRTIGRQSQHHVFTGLVVGDGQRRGRLLGAGEAKRRAVGHDAAGGVERDLALAQQRLVQIQGEKSPETAAVGLAPVAHIAFEIVFRLLEMVRAQKHPLSPDNLMSIFHHHTYSYFASAQR